MSLKLFLCRELQISSDARQMADKDGFEIQGYEISAQPEQLRTPRRVSDLDFSTIEVARWAPILPDARGGVLGKLKEVLMGFPECER